jgi:DNA-binding NtrC family response regulator
MREGAYHYLAKPFDLDELIEVVGSAAEQVHKLRALHAVHPDGCDPLFPIVFRSQAMRSLLSMARDVADSNAAVLIQGSSGAGKELLARAIHAMSRRASGPFVAVDSGAIPEGLLESELFGHCRGSFTGAVSDKPGIIEQADQGTLFLDEVGNLASPVQAKLLRFLQERCYRRVGEVNERTVDVRLVSATNKDLVELVDRGGFRDDLYYRLSVITLQIPSLGERREDIPPLVYHFIRKLNAASSYRVEGVRKEALDLLVDYAWPGNVRQLENVMERAVILRRAGMIQSSDLPQEIVAASGAQTSSRTLEEIEREHILELLDRCDGNQSRVAKVLGISRRTVYRKLKSYGHLKEDE